MTILLNFMNCGSKRGINTLKVLGASAAFIWTLGVFRIAYKKLVKKGKRKIAKELKYVRLLDLESRLFQIGEVPISTITWFKGDHNIAASILRSNVQEILQINPWLGGCLVKRKGKVFISFKQRTLFNDTKRIFTHISDPKKSTAVRNISIDKMSSDTSSFKSLLVKKRLGAPLWTVSVLPCSKEPSDYFAVVHSLSHVIADGYTYYSVQKMLFAQNKDDMTALTVNRLHRTSDLQKEALGKEECNFFTSPGFAVNVLSGLLWTKLFSPVIGPKIKTISHSIDPFKMRDLKLMEAKKGGVPFVSTNDVITSWFFKNSGCNFGQMALNLRERLREHTNTMAGNYDFYLFYNNNEDSTSSALIRKSLDNLKRAVTFNKPMPSFFDHLNSTTALISNWSTFASTNELEGCVEDLHVPLYDFASICPLTMCCACIYRAGPGKINVIVVGPASIVEGLKDPDFV